MKVIPGKNVAVFNEHEVIALQDDDHTPYNKRPGSCESELEVRIRAPNHNKWVNFLVSESTRPFMAPKSKSRTRQISFTITRQQFEAIAEHVRRGDVK